MTIKRSSNSSFRFGWCFLCPFPPKVFLSTVSSVVFWLSLPHELLHYIPARLLGLEAHIEPGRTLVKKSQQTWKRVVIALTPAFAALLLAVFCAWMSTQAQGKWQEFWIIETGTALCAFWGCAKDMQDARGLMRVTRGT